MAGSADEVLTIEELADYLKVPKSTLYKLVREGSVPCQKVGKHWRFHKEAIDDWLQQRVKKEGTRETGSGRLPL
jgi:excisionase family DNA binding protein